MIIAPIAAKDATGLAPILEPLFGPVVARNAGRMTMADVVELIADERGKLWLAVDGGDVLGGLIAAPVQYSRRKALSVIYLAGQHRERWQSPMMAVLEGGARHIGCDLLEATGRRGFTRIIPGWKATGYSIEKDLAGGVV